jgi:hypothetical protein
MMRNSVLEGLCVRKLVDIQLETLEIAVSRRAIAYYENKRQLRKIRKVECHLPKDDDLQMS